MIEVKAFVFYYSLLIVCFDNQDGSGKFANTFEVVSFFLSILGVIAVLKLLLYFIY